MASSLYIKAVNLTQKQLTTISNYKLADEIYRYYWNEMIKDSKFKEIEDSFKDIGFDKYQELISQNYPEYVTAFNQKQNLEEKYSIVLKKFKLSNDYICVYKDLLHKLFEPYKGTEQLAQLFNPIVLADFNLIMTLRKCYNRPELKNYDKDDKNLLINFVKSNLGKYLYH